MLNRINILSVALAATAIPPTIPNAALTNQPWRKRTGIQSGGSGWVRRKTDEDNTVAGFKATPDQRKMLRRHEILCHRARNAKRNLRQGFVTSDFYKKAVARVEAIQDRMLYDLMVPARVIVAHHTIHTRF